MPETPWQKKSTSNPIDKEVRSHLLVELALIRCEHGAAVAYYNPTTAQVTASSGELALKMWTVCRTEAEEPGLYCAQTAIQQLLSAVRKTPFERDKETNFCEFLGFQFSSLSVKGEESVYLADPGGILFMTESKCL